MEKRIIRLVNLNASNFKGIKNLQVNFGEINYINGDNGRNKSTIQLCVKYGLLEGVNNIKQLAKDGKIIYGLNPLVELTFYKDGVVKKFTRSNVENWVKKKGDTKNVLAGYKTLHYIDGVGVSQGEYSKVLKEFLEVDSLKMLIDPGVFPSLDWKEQRKIALEIIGDVSNEMVIGKNEDLIPLREILKETTVNDYLKVTKSKITKVKEEMNTIPWRIEECRNQVEDIKDIDGYKFRLRSIKSGLKVLNKSRDEIFINLNEKNNLNEKIFSLKEEKRALERKKVKEMEAPILEKKEKSSKLRKQIEVLESSLALNNRNLLSLKEELKVKKEKHAIYFIKQEKLRESWREEERREVVFTKDDTLCPLCMRAYEGEDLEKAKEKAIKLHEEIKESRLETISKEGKSLAKFLETLNGDMDEVKKEIEEIIKKISSINKEKEEFITEFRLLKEEIAEFKLEEPYVEEENTLDKEIEALCEKVESLTIPNEKDVKEKISSLLEEEREVEKILLKWEENQRFEKRIEELEDRRKELEERQASLERREYLCEEFIRTKVSFLEEKINSKFSLVSFKLFKEQINGGLQETCECTLDGVPYSSLNTAAKINAGLDIINTLSNHYGLSAPVFIDNRESINNILSTEAQVVNLVVSKDKELVINNEVPLKDEILKKVNIYLDREKEEDESTVETKEEVLEPMNKRKREIDF